MLPRAGQALGLGPLNPLLPSAHTPTDTPEAPASRTMQEPGHRARRRGLTAQKQAPFRAGYAIVQGRPDKAIPPRLIKSATLPAHTSSQQAELLALTQALTLAKDQKVNIYTDSKYVYNITF